MSSTQPIRTTVGLAARYAWVFVLAWVLSLAIAEVAFRRLGTRIAATMEGFYEPFGRGSYRHSPCESVYMNWFSGGFWVHTDELGMRVGSPCHAHPATSREPTGPDILVLGDSEAFGSGLDHEKTTIGRFAIALAARGLKVANAAVIGHFPPNQRELLDNLLEHRGVAPQVVLYCITPHAIGYADEYGKAHVHNSTLYAYPPGRVQLLKKWLNCHSAVYVTLRDALKPEDHGEEAHATTFNLYCGLGRRERVSQIRGTLASMQERLAKDGARLVVAYLPLAYEHDLGRLAKEFHRPTVDPNLPGDALRQAADDLGLACIDLRLALQEAIAEGDPLELRGDPHYSSELCARAAVHLVRGADWGGLVRGRSQPAGMLATGHPAIPKAEGKESPR